jgi:hypothetical protein
MVSGLDRAAHEFGATKLLAILALRSDDRNEQLLLTRVCRRIG